MWQIVVPLSLIVACAAGVRRERRTLRHQLRNEMEEAGELYGLTPEVKTKILTSVSSFKTLARLDEQTWWHRKVLCLRRRSSMRERLLCACEDDAQRAVCLDARVMRCRTSDHDILHKCKKIPWPWQDEVDKTAHNANLSDADRENLRLKIRAMDQLNQLKQNLANWADLGTVFLTGSARASAAGTRTDTAGAHCCRVECGGKCADASELRGAVLRARTWHRSSRLVRVLQAQAQGGALAGRLQYGRRLCFGTRPAAAAAAAAAGAGAGAAA